MQVRFYAFWLVLIAILIGTVLGNRQQKRKDFERLESEADNIGGVSAFDNKSFNNPLQNDNLVCPDSNMWFIYKDGSCKCGSTFNGLVQCNSVTKELGVLDCYCITDHRTPKGKLVPVVGSCVFNCGNLSHSVIDRIYHTAPSNCSQLNRQGTLCGQCLDGYAVPAYGYNFNCMKCNSELQSWWLYLAYAFLPLTIFIVIILVFRINVVSPKLYVFVFAAQNISTPINLRVLLTQISLDTTPLYSKVAVLFMATVYGIWNLDFFRVNVLPDVCINVAPLHIRALDYLVAIYPMLLMGVSYIIVELHGCGFKPVLCMWRPFHGFFVRFRRHWGIQTSIMEAFVTFFVLATTKTFSVSYEFLIGARLFMRDGKTAWYLYSEPDIKYFGVNHLPYALMALIVSFVFIFFPLSLLLCFQSKWFRKCLTKCQLRGPTLNEFVHTYQRYYKDGSNGTWDCRWFAAYYIIIKIAAFFTYAVSLAEISYVFITIVSIIAAVISVIVQPYREEYDMFNTISAVFLLWQAILFALMAKEGLSRLLATRFKDGFISFVVFSFAPLVYIIAVTGHHFVKRCNCKCVKESSPTLSPLPDRLLHSNQYRDFGIISTPPQTVLDTDMHL